MRAALCVVLFLVLASTLRADEDGTLRIPVGGEPRSAAELVELEQATRGEIAALVAAPAPDAAQQAERLEAMEAQAAALQATAELMVQVQEAPETAATLRETLASEREALTRLQEQGAALPTLAPPIDEELIRALEAASGKAAQEAKDADNAAAQLEDQGKKRQAELGTLDARGTELAAERQALADRLTAAPETDARERELLGRRIQAAEVLQGLVGLKQAHRTALVELDTLRSDLARIRVELAGVRKRVCDAELEQARGVHQAQVESEARRKQAEAERRLREAERADSAAGKAISRLGTLVSRMENELVQDQKLTSRLDAAAAEGRTLQQGATTHYESLRLLYPAGAPLAKWQADAVGEQMRLLDLDHSAFAAYRAEVVPDITEFLAGRLTQRGQLEIFRNRVSATTDQLERSRDDAARAAAIDRDLARTLDDDFRVWLTARRDFLDGRLDSKLTSDDVAVLRTDWEKNATQLREVGKKRLDEMDLQIRRVGEIESIVEGLAEVLERRSEHLARIAFWLRDDAVYSSARMEEVKAEASRLGHRIAGTPAHVASLRPASGTAAVTAVVAAFLALVLGLWLRRRGPALPRPVGGGERRRAVLLDAVGRVARRLFLPASLLAVAVFVHHAVFPGAPSALVLVALLGSWTGVSLSRGLVDAFLTPDSEGRCAAGCTPETAARARRVLRPALQGSAFLFAGVLLLSAADAPRLASALGFVWGTLGVFTGALLVFWPDVLALLVLVPAGTILARTLNGTLRVLWPLLVLFGVAVLVMYALGYRNASIHYASRALLLVALFGAIGVVYGLLHLLLDARRRPPVEESEEASAAGFEEFALGRRFLGGLLALAALAGVLLAITTVFELEWEDWRAFADLSLVGAEPGVGLTPGKIGHALLLLVLTIGVARYLRDVVRGLLRTSRLPLGTRYAIRTLLFYVTVTVGVLASLAALGVSTDQFGWFLAAAGVGIGFGLQEIISNFVCGLILFFERPVQVGDIITVGDIEGDVTGISIRSTVVRTRDGVSMILPNKKLITEDVVNWSHGNQRTRLNIEVSVAYGSDVDLVKTLLLGIAADERRALRRPSPEVDFSAFGESELQFMLRLWLATPDIATRRRVRTAVLTEVDGRFAEHGVEIPFPQRDLHLRTSDIGRLAGSAEDAQADVPAPEA